jgi:hypothetical protein
VHQAAERASSEEVKPCSHAQTGLGHSCWRPSSLTQQCVVLPVAPDPGSLERGACMIVLACTSVVVADCPLPRMCGTRPAHHANIEYGSCNTHFFSSFTHNAIKSPYSCQLAASCNERASVIATCKFPGLFTLLYELVMAVHGLDLLLTHPFSPGCSRQ